MIPEHSAGGAARPVDAGSSLSGCMSLDETTTDSRRRRRRSRRRRMI